MKPATHIDKLQPDPDGLDFDWLRAEGIRLAQQMSGDLWTDYNLHDPGITILEVLCYALTDLAYRAGLDAADYLASGNGEIDFEKLGLFRPDEILPCRPLTDNDYRKLILDAMPGADNVWIERHADKPGETPGLCRINVLLGEQASDQCDEGARRKYADYIGQVYTAHRNLCEDLAEVEVVKRVPYWLSGEIETDGRRDPANILAEIHFECARYLTPRSGVRSYPEAHAEGSSLETLFTGVLTGNGYIADDELCEWRGQFSISELAGKIVRIEGVRNIARLFFVDAAGAHLEYIDLGSAHARKAVACLQRHSTHGGGGIRLHKSGQTHMISAQDVEMEYARLDFKARALRHQENTFDWVGAMLPSSAPQNINEYYSIQNHFPAVYGINAYGVPDSFPAHRKAQAMQLKAYLLIFEQFMANFLQNAHEIRSLFSLDEGLTRSYFFQVLRNTEVPRAEDLYAGDIAQIGAAMSRQLAQFDHFGDRRNRVLDYLLGLYGEKFSQHSLRHFFAEDAETARALIRNKIAFLKDIVSISQNRAAAFDYRRPVNDDNCTGLQKKLKLLLGLGEGETPPAAPILGDISQARNGITIVEHVLLRPLGRDAHGELYVPSDFYGFRASVIFHSPADHPAGTEFRKLAEQTVYLNCPAHIQPEIFWLDARLMHEFHTLHERWLQAKRAGGLNAGIVNAAAARLIGFLLGIRREDNG